MHLVLQSAVYNKQLDHIEGVYNLGQAFVFSKFFDECERLQQNRDLLVATISLYDDELALGKIIFSRHTEKAKIRETLVELATSQEVATIRI